MERITEQTEVKKLCGQIDTVTEELAVLKRLLMEEVPRTEGTCEYTPH